MKSSTIFILLFSMALLIQSCKKDSSDACTDKQLPGAYFPAYPKSWWSYMDYNNNLIRYQISDDYRDCEGACRPVFLNLDKCIQGEWFIQRFYTGQGKTATVPSPIYSLTLDSVLVCPVSFSTFQQTTAFLGEEDVPYRRKTILKDTLITLNYQTYTNVIVVKEYNIFDSTHLYYDYFSKDIGLIKRDSVDVNDPTHLIQILKLVDFSIGD